MSFNPYQPFNPDQQYASTPTTPAYSTWELEQDPSSNLPPPQPQDQHHQPQAYAPSAIQLPERVAGPSQGSWRLRDYVHQPAVHQSEESASHVPPPPASHGGLPTRSSSARDRARAAAHPYRRQSEPQGMRTRTDVPPSESGHPLRLAIPPVMGSSAITLGCPAQGHRPSSPGTTSPANAQAPPVPSSSSEATRNYMIRADVYYDPNTNSLKAMYELPGMKKNDVKIMLSKCPYTRVKQILVSGRNYHVFPDRAYSVRERKFGRFARTLIVPPETTPEKVVVDMEDGILTITVPGPATPEPLEEPAIILFS